MHAIHCIRLTGGDDEETRDERDEREFASAPTTASPRVPPNLSSCEAGHVVPPTRPDTRLRLAVVSRASSSTLEPTSRRAATATPRQPRQTGWAQGPDDCCILPSVLVSICPSPLSALSIAGLNPSQTLVAMPEEAVNASCGPRCPTCNALLPRGITSM